MLLRFRVALLMESSRTYARNILRGIADYAKTYGPWTFLQEERTLGDPLPLDLKAWRPDGIIARIANPSDARALRRLNVPIVDMLHEDGIEGIPVVIVDQEAIARLAADHLRSLGLKQFAYCGLPGVTFSEIRCRCFTQYLESRGYEVYIYQPPERAAKNGLAMIEAQARRQGAALAAWLRGLPKPIGLMACHDMRGYQVLATCNECGINVPDDIAVIGVDNDVVHCELCAPPLSSIDTGGHRIGYEAAAMLHRMIEGSLPVTPVTYLAPAGVMARGSTAVLAIADREMMDVVRYVREHACERLTIRDLAKKFAISRSTLDRWFAKHLGRAPKEEIQHVRIERVKELLLSTDSSIDEIARLTGFDHVATMFRLVKRVTGHTPCEHRSQRSAYELKSTNAADPRRTADMRAVWSMRQTRTLFDAKHHCF